MASVPQKDTGRVLRIVITSSVLSERLITLTHKISSLVNRFFAKCIRGLMSR